MNKIFYTSQLEKHKRHMLDKCYQVFPDVILDAQFNAFPVMSWVLPEVLPDLAYVYILYPAKYNSFASFCEEEIVSFSNISLEVVSKNMTNLQHEGMKEKLCFLEFCVILNHAEEKNILQKNVHLFREKLKQNILYNREKYGCFRKKGGNAFRRRSIMYERMVLYIERFPTLFDHDILAESEKFCAYLKEDFQKYHDLFFVARLSLAYSVYKRALCHDVSVSSQKRYIYMKGFQTEVLYTFGTKPTTGFLILFNLLHPYELFTQNHLLKSLHHIFPDIYIVQQSFVSLREETPLLMTIYVELEKKGGTRVSRTEVLALQEKWPSEIKESIEPTSPSLFFPRNEEEVYKNILRLSQELKFVKDLPQAMISFREQSHSHLKFNVILLRIVDKSVISIPKLFEKHPSNVILYHEKSTQVGRLRKKYFKQADCFILEMSLDPFLRKNSSIDLMAAREYIVCYLERVIGAFRDFNGGFFLKQKEQCAEITHSMSFAFKKYTYILEELLYSLNPQFFITFITPQTGEMMCALLDQLICQDLGSSRYIYRIEQHENTTIMMIKTDDRKIKSILEAKISGDLLEEAVSSIELDHHLYVCYLVFQFTVLHAFEEELITLLGDTQHPQQQRTLRLYLPQPIYSLDPRIGSDRFSGIILQMLYTGLMRHTIDGLQSSIAKSYTVSSDKKTYTFVLNKSYWSDGSELTAMDFAYAWKKHVEPNYISPYTFLFSNIKNADLVKKGLLPVDRIGIDVLDSHILQVELEYPADHFLSLIAHWIFLPLCKKIDEAHPGWATMTGSQLISNGPFSLVQWNSSAEFLLEKNPYYWKAESVKINRIQMNVIRNEELASALFKEGKLDWLGDPISKIPIKDLPYYQEHQEIHILDSYGLYWIQLDIEHIFFRSSLMRRAFSYAIDRKTLTELLHTEDEPSTSLYNDKTHFLNQCTNNNLEEARRLFASGLKEQNVTIDQLPPLVISCSDFNEHFVLAKALSQQWEVAFGIKVVFEHSPWMRFMKSLGDHAYMCAIVAWHARYDDPLYYLDLLTTREYGIRISKWSNTVYDQWMMNAKQSTHPMVKKKWGLLAEHLVLQHMPLIPLFFQKWKYLKNPRLTRVGVSDVGLIDFSEAEFI